jgi:hypothetical protein
MLTVVWLRRWSLALAVLFVVSMNLVLQPPCALAQESASVSGRVTDGTASAVPGAEVEIKDVDTGFSQTTKTNGDGFYSFPALKPGRYLMTVRKQSFEIVSVTGIILNVQEKVSHSFVLKVGSVAETVTVTAQTNHVNTTDGTVSTVIEREMVENMPLNGRSFQSLLELTPGINPAVPGPVNGGVNQQGQFTVNGQRGDANYFTVDGVSANTGSSAGNFIGQGGSGSLPGTTALGGFNSLVSIDALQEFRVSTSSFAPENGRTPGGQVSLVTRSGTNSFHGDVFDYLRNTAFNANDWFLNSANKPRSAEHQNDFGGVFGGPVVKDKLFFFLSYEGLRLTNPQPALIETFTSNARTQAASAANGTSGYTGYMAQILNAYPLPDGNPATTCVRDPMSVLGISGCTAPFTGAFPNTSQVDSGSARIDYALNTKMTLFGRYVHAPSSTFANGSSSSINGTGVTLDSDSGTIGLTSINSDLRFNYSHSTLLLTQPAPSFTGNLSTLFPAGFAQPTGYSLSNMQLSFQFLGVVPQLNIAQTAVDSAQGQFDLVDTLSMVKGAHTLKFGGDFRLTDPNLNVAPYSLNAIFYQSFGSPSCNSGPPVFPPPPSPPQFICGKASSTIIQRNSVQDFRFQNWSFFFQDAWKIAPRLTLTYGARYEVNPPPYSTNGKPFFALTNWDPVQCSTVPASLPPGTTFCNVGIAPLGTAPYPTTWTNVAPRIGVAYQLSQNPNWSRVLRAGFGIFYDTGSDAAAGTAGPFSPVTSFPPPGFPQSLQFPVSSANAQYVTPPAVQTNIGPTPDSQYNNAAFAVVPDLKLPRTYEFNASIQQAVGSNQSFTLSYIGALGRDLIGDVPIFPINLLNGMLTIPVSPTFKNNLVVYGNYATSDYHALQGLFQRQFSHGLGATGSYTWSHSIDDASNFNPGRTTAAVFPLSIFRSSSDFDIRQTFTASLVYDIPTPFKDSKIASAILGHWSVDPIYHFQTSPPVDVFYSSNFDGNLLGYSRPSFVTGIPLYVYGAQYPGGKAFNSAPLINFDNGTGVFPYPQCMPSPDSSTPVGAGPFCQSNATPVSPGHVMTAPSIGRNFLRGFPLQQLDLDFHRDLPFGERVHIRFEGDFFNVFNHPNFASPNNIITGQDFGRSTAMLSSSFGTGNAATGGGYNSLYSVGGPRSVQLALKILF